MDGRVVLTSPLTPKAIAMIDHPQIARPSVPTRAARRPANARLSRFALVVLIANGIGAGLAVAANWPSQFGGIAGTGAGQDWLSRGTALSAPLAPMACFVLIAVLVRLAGRVGRLGVHLALLTAPLVFVGGMGELVAEPTDSVPRAVLVTAGGLWSVVAATFVVLGIAAARERRPHRDAT